MNSLQTPQTEIRPRVVHVTTSHLADDVRIFERECQSLAASNLYDVYLVATGDIDPNSKVTLIPLISSQKNRLSRFFSGPRKAAAISRAIDADLWHFHDPELLPLAIRMALSRKKVVWDAHEDYASQFTSNGAKKWIPKPARKIVRVGMNFMLWMIDRFASGIVAATPVIASRYTNPQTVVVGNEARIEVFSHCQPKFTSRQVLFTGSPSEAHLFSQIVDAIVKIPSVNLAVAGREPDSNLWEQARLKLGDRLQHLGWLGRQDLAEAMNQSVLGLLTYADTDAYAVGSPTKGYEFAAAGLPVVASPNSMNRKMLSRSGAGFMAEDFSSQALMTTITDALLDENTWGAASRAGQIWAKDEGSWSGSQKRLFSLYEDVLLG
jgi:glycosyltransferase involved in cell wall biosynthesis